MLMELLWIAGTLDLRRPSKYRAPSWSWMSVDGPIHYFTETDTDDLDKWAEIVAVAVTTVDGTIAGQVESGSIRIKGKITTEIIGRNENTTDDDIEPGADDIESFFDYDYIDGIEISRSQALSYLALLNSYMESLVWGLILHRLENGYFKRRGRFKVCLSYEAWKALERLPSETVNII